MHSAVQAEPAPAAPAAVDFRAIYEAEFDYVWHSLRRIGVADRDLEDLCHDVFVAFYRSLDGAYDPSRPLRPWLFGIAFRVASDFRRKGQQRFEVVAPAAEPPDGTPRADQQLVEAERRRVVATALGALNPDQRAVFVLHEIDGLSMPEIAAVVDAPLNTLYSRLRLARAEFAAVVRRSLKHE